jgi:hypothetical protein
VRRTLIACVVAAFFIAGGTATASKLITGKDIKNGTIKLADLSAGTRAALKGHTGPRGAQGASGLSAISQLGTIASPEEPFGSEIVASATAYCPSGQRAISGGGVSISDEEIAASLPTPGRTGWFVIGVDLIDDGGTSYVQAVANCAPLGSAVAASAPSRAADKRYIARMTAKLAAEVHATK